MNIVNKVKLLAEFCINLAGVLCFYGKYVFLKNRNFVLGNKK